MWLEVSAEEKVHSKSLLCEDDGTMLCTKQQVGYSSQYRDPTKIFLPACGPFPLLLLPSQVLWPPYSLPSREGNSPAAKMRTRHNCQPLPCQGQASWQTRSHLSSKLWQKKRAVLGLITHRPVDIHHGLEVLSPEDGASHRGHPYLSLCKSWSWGEDMNYMDMPYYIQRKKSQLFFLSRKSLTLLKWSWLPI